MPKIRVLSDILASQVAAGEVVERPASVVKELVENSIDAGAGEVRVDVDRGGSALIRVSDDGCGMSREDALLSLERHATSKLRTAGDLAAIRTLGFRGEAVPSIASVSRFRMVTRERDAVAGTEILVDGGKLRDVRDAGCAPGTVIEAKALFFNMPARRKFLRAESTESAHVEHQLRLHALAAPSVRFRLRRDEREVFDLPPVAKAVDRVRQLLGNELGRELVALPTTHGNGVVVEGFVLPAAHARKGRRHQFVFLNGRPVEDAVISRALADGFRGALPAGLYPAAWLWLDLEPTLVDVNVHPAKREVRFHRPMDVRDAITEAVLAGLKPPVPVAPQPIVAGQGRQHPGWMETRDAVPPHAVQPLRPVPKWLVPVQPNLPLKPAAETAAETDPVPGGAATMPGEAGAPEIPDSQAVARAAAFRIMDLLLQRWVVMETAEGLVLFDPKAAKERILYEKLLGQHDGTVTTQSLLVPVLLEMDPRDHDLVLRERMALAASGIEVEGFGGNTLQVRHLPACVTVENPREFIGALLDELLHDVAPGPRFAAERVARALAKRAAATVVARLNEASALLIELFACELPYCAPDGRPTLSEIGVRELERRFSGGR
ncbi:MAG: DNA mismatch repair endonuclease MutL [Akkermansiaceae bacterium]|nr:DNA mismatch repair endonuclease MutL [Akkermansiaceae bacterium]MCF7734314.1 DNA mismatch repair endonuclease MutL [Akkermansiaceae bacterium]